MGINHLQDQKLLKRVIKGDGEAFSRLLETHYEMIFSIAFKWIGNREDAEDITQEVCIKIGRSINAFKMESKFSTWIYRITINTAKDHRRRQRHHSNIDELDETILAEASRGNEVSIEAELERKQIWRQVNRLPDRQRDAVLMVYAQGLTHDEAALVMDCKPGTIAWYINQAKTQLKTEMVCDGR